MTQTAYSALDAVRESGIVIASDGAEYKKIKVYNPTDATTNPSLVYAAVTTPEYSHILDTAVKHAQTRLPHGTLQERTELALDKLLVDVGFEILSLIPGRVSVSVDPRLGYSYDAIIAKGLSLISLFEELSINKDRILIKIPATAAGIHAAHTLEHSHNIHTNMTLIFSLVQAVACGQAGLSVISPFIGRVKDWWHTKAISEGLPNGLNDQPLAEHPGIDLVRRIRAAYTSYGYKTQVMAAGFRKVDEIIELSRLGNIGGPDLVTLPPDLLQGLQDRVASQDSRRQVAPEGVDLAPLSNYFSEGGPTAGDLNAFNRDLAIEGIALDKVPEGLSKFSVDAVKLEEAVRTRVIEYEAAPRSPSLNHGSTRAHKKGVSSGSYRMPVQVQ